MPTTHLMTTVTVSLDIMTTSLIEFVLSVCLNATLAPMLLSAVRVKMLARESYLEPICALALMNIYR